MNWDSKSVPTRLTGGKHAAIFFEGPFLYAEFDAFVIDRVKAINKDDIIALYALLQEYQKDIEQFAKSHPAVATVATAAAKQLPGAILKALGISSAQALQVGVVFLLIEIAVLIIRAVEINYYHMNSVSGGVLIQIIFPSPQAMSIVLPRGGFKESSGVQAKSAVAVGAKAKIVSAARSVRDRVAGWRL